MGETSDHARPGAGFASVLTDPTVSRAAKAVLLAWRDRDWLDAADDARLLAGVFEAEADRLIRRLSCPFG